MPDQFSTDVLIGVVQGLQVPSGFLLGRYFDVIQEETSEEIHFDDRSLPQTLAPFVSPVVEGQIVQARGFTTKTFKPAYVKPKTPWDPGRALKRTAGEQIGGSLAPADRMRAQVAMTLEDHVTMIKRRLENMAAEVLRTGAVTIAGEKYVTTNVDFGRDASLTVALAGADLWSAAGTSHPLDDLADWAALIIKASGAGPIDVIMEVDAWKTFRKHAEVVAKLNVRNAKGDAIDLGALRQIGGSLMGTIDGFNIFVYQQYYQDSAGVIQPFLPSGTVLMTSPGPQGLAGLQAFGAIQDEAAGLRPMAYFPKSWVENDPPVRMVMTQSAPLIVPQRVNACLAATVL